MFGSNLRKELDITKTEFEYFRKQSNDSYDALERMIEKEHGSTMSYAKLVADFSKIGDPYFNNLFVKKCIDKIAGNIAGVEIEIRNNDKPLPETTPAQKLFKYINEDDSSVDFVFEMVRSLQRLGKTHVLLSEESIGGLPIAMTVLDSDKVKPILDGNKILKQWEYGRKKFEAERILFIRYKHPKDTYDGIAPGSAAIKEILQDFYAQTYNIKNFQQGAMGKGAWVDPDGKDLTVKQKQEAQFAVDNEFNKGVDGAGGSKVMKRRLDWVRTSETNRDLEFKELLESMRDSIYIAYDVPKVLFASADTTFTNLKEAKNLFWNQTLFPIIQLISESFNTNFFAKRKLPYKLHFLTENVPELQVGITEQIVDYSALVATGVPPSIASERTGLDLPSWPGWDSPPSTYAFDTEPEETKELNISEIYKEFRKQDAIEREKQLVNDDWLKQQEYQKTLQIVLEYEKTLSNKVKAFYSDLWKEVEDYIGKNEVKEVKSLVDPNWIQDFSNWLKNHDWGQAFFAQVSGTIETVFQRGVFRSYSGIGANFQLKPQRAISYIINRGLKLKGSPKDVQDAIINMLEKETFTIDQMAKSISDKWKTATAGKAKNIAITESTAGYSAGRVTGMKELGIPKKGWVHSHDAKVRDSHRIDQEVAVDDYFTLASGVRVRWPGDGPSSEACNCRCCVISIL